MRIAIEATLAQRQPTGMGQYVIRLLQGLSEIAGDEYEFLLLHSGKEWEGPDFGRRFKPVSYYFYKQSLAIYFRLNHILRSNHVDLFHATGTTGAPPHTSVPVLSTIHDIYPLNHPEECSRSQAFFFQLLFGWTLKGSDYFVTDSYFIAEELIKSTKITKDVLTTIPLAPCVDGEIADIVRAGDGDYFLCVGAIDPRKGQLDLLEGYVSALQNRVSFPRLKYVGPDRGRAIALCEGIAKWDVGSQVEWSSFVSDQELREYFKNAKAFIFPSTYEGFGLPLLEAMCFGIPVICSDIPVFREIGGCYPVYVSPDPESWADALSIFVDGGYTEHFAKQAPRNELDRFSWRKCAEETLRCYQFVVEKYAKRYR